MTVSIRNLTKHKVAVVPYEALADEILGQFYDVSIAYVDSPTSKSLNLKYRKIDEPTNILSFNLDKSSGELVVNITTISKEACELDINVRDYSIYLIIHGMLHLKGCEHSRKMRKLEEMYVNKYCVRDGELVLKHFL